MNTTAQGQNARSGLLTLMIGAVGIVFGDIGTSPLYAVKEALGGAHAPAPLPENVLGVISLIIWTILVVLTLKYQLFIMRADNHGEGGTLALVALARKFSSGSAHLHRFVMITGMIGVSLFFGDGVITPAISVLSAVEGLEVATPAFKPYIIPVTLLVLFLLFSVQSKGTARIGRLFGPICLVWFLALAGIGLKEIFGHPGILTALNPLHGIRFLLDGSHGSVFPVLGSVFLAVTGAEALYADMGHFGKSAINWSWGSVVFPALTLNYLGQGALILGDPTAVTNPFYLSVPTWGLLPMVALATAATIIASQAVISGAFSATQQAMQLGYLPRLRVVHTSSSEIGQIYVPVTNWLLLLAVVALVIGFENSSNLAAAYGIAVTGTMISVTILAFGIVLRHMCSWSWFKTIPLLVFFLTVDMVFFGANAIKILDGGWFSLAIGAVLFFLMLTWRQGQEMVRQAVRKEEILLEPFLRRFDATAINRVPGTAVFMTSNLEVAPPALVQMVAHTLTLKERAIIVCVQNIDIPFVAHSDRMAVEVPFSHLYRITLRYGFMESPDVPRALAECILPNGERVDVEQTHFFLGKANFVAGHPSGMATWRLHFFLTLFRNSESATHFFNLPPVRVVDIGTRIVLNGHQDGTSEIPSR
ncbi:MAG: potassium transporter Kup [Magnetococcales bacterium]|nr:potassium transporter Kup [Magnetococcales bacterium]MBF0150679.1 potassium transporter Kup [Magnetococcales bacterium]MBF0173176.1 potassium transporter Kup [Magnetococcales bacterium]MBF0631697.1 potassium transporter Kup [Magnetococcales bacterium]